jgi:hypothetical protein
MSKITMAETRPFKVVFAPIELKMTVLDVILVVMATIISYFGKLHDNYGIGVVGEIPMKNFNIIVDEFSRFINCRYFDT